MAQRSNAGAVFAGHFGARSSNSATNHVPNQQSIDTLIPRNDFGAQPGVYARPGVMLRVGAGVGANAPQNEFVGVWRAFKNVCVVPIKASFKLDGGCSTAWHRDGVIMPIVSPRRIPVLDESTVLHMIQNVANKIPLLSHGRGKLPAYAFDSASEQTAVVELVFSQTMLAELVRLGFEDFGELKDFCF